MRFDCLDDWLHWQESLNPAEIDLGLDRVTRVLTQAGLSTSFDCPLITVAGTNGKGSVVAMLEAIAITAGLKVCSYTSPHIFRYNERIKINGKAIGDHVLCEAFERIDKARGDNKLTYFEFGTLAAIDIFFRSEPDLVILEVGLGGRLDAVNIMDPDVSVLTSVAIDHIDWLGDDRESIGYEKAGIFRAEKPVICGERDAPASVLKQVNKLRCGLFQAGRDYDVIDEDVKNDVSVRTSDSHWTLKSRDVELSGLPRPSLVGEFQKSNAATAIMAMLVLQSKGLIFPASLKEKLNPLIRAIPAALTSIRLPGRFQLIHTCPSVYVDVAHNLQAAQALATQLKLENSIRQSGKKNHTWAIVAMLADKDITGVLNSVVDEIDFWCFSGLEKQSRGASVQHMLKNTPSSILPRVNAIMDTESATELQDKLMANQCTILSETVLLAKTVTDACRLVLSKADKNDRIIIFGSFYTVAESMHFFTRLKEDAVELIN